MQSPASGWWLIWIRHIGPGFGEFKVDYESIFERMSRAVGRGGPGSIHSAVVDYGNPAVMHGAKANTSVPCKNDAEVLEGLLQVIPGHEFSFGRFTALADAMGCRSISLLYLTCSLMTS